MKKYLIFLSAVLLFVSCMTMIAACNDDSSNLYPGKETIQLPAPIITLSNGVVSWDAVENASYYTFAIYLLADPDTGVAINMHTFTGTCSTTYFDLRYVPIFPSKGGIIPIPPGPYSVSIKAVGQTIGSIEYTDSDFSAPKEFTSDDLKYKVELLAPIITVEDGIVSWSKVENASYYLFEIYILADSDTHVAVWEKVVSQKSYNLSFDIREISLPTDTPPISLIPPGPYRVAVKAVGQSIGNYLYLDSEFSAPKEFELSGIYYRTQLSTPSVLAVENNVLSWLPVENANYYLIEFAYNVSSDGYTLAFAITLRPSLDLKELHLEAGVYELSIKAVGQTIGNITYIDSDFGPSVEIVIDDL